MNIEILIHNKRGLEKQIKKGSRIAVDQLKDLLLLYYNNTSVCEHAYYCDNGYYRYHNNDLCITDREHADFRSIVCPICHQNVCLIKTANRKWDTTFMEKPLAIYSLQEMSVLEVGNSKEQADGKKSKIFIDGR